MSSSRGSGLTSLLHYLEQQFYKKKSFSSKWYRFIKTNFWFLTRLASVGILGKERDSGVGKLGWHGNFDTGFERNTVISFNIPCAGLLNFSDKATAY